jgi:hypothetical protein
MNEYDKLTENYKNLKAENYRLTQELEQRYESYNDLLRRFRHLIQSDFIRSFDEWDINKGDYVRDISEADKRIMFLCDLKNKCHKSMTCAKVEGCLHTADIAHARHFKKDISGNYWEARGVCPFGDAKETCADYRINKCDLCRFANNKMS